MPTLASLAGMLGDTQIRPWSQGMESVNRAQLGGQEVQTGLIKLAQLKQSQASEQEVMAAIQRDPSLQALLFGGGMPQSTLGSLGTAPGGAPPAPGPITQSPLGGGAAQSIPAYPDASRFANVPPTGGGPIPPNVMGQTMPTVSPPPGTPTLATLGQGGMPGAPQGPPQPQQNPLLEMARRDPRAALALQQQLEGRQDAAMKRQEQQLGMGVKVAEFVARELQGVTDQASLDQARERVRQVHPQAAAQMPQMYSKEAVESVQQRGIAIADRAKTQLDEAKARNLDMETRMFPELAQRFGMGDGAQVPADEGAQTATGPQARTAPPEFESAITEANRLYPQVSTTRIKSIIAAESNFDPKAISSAGAKGPMQLMDGTAKEMGVDDPFNVQQNVRGGTRYYAQLLTKYGGDERKALAAYNWGPGNLDKVGGDVSKAPPETQAYVNRVLGGGGGGGTPGTAQAAPAAPRIAQLDAQIAKRTQEAKIASLMKNESLSTRLNDDANRLKDERTRLLEDSRRQQERAEEIPRAAQKQTAELEAKQQFEEKRQAGRMLPEERRKVLSGLRADVLKEPTFKLYQDVRNGYQNVRIGAQTNSAQGDLAIINGMAKILDPNSTVMSGEARNVETAQGELERWFNSPQRFFEGDRLTVPNRQNFLRLAHEMATEKLTTAQGELETVWGPFAKEAGLDFKQVVPLPDLKPLPTSAKGAENLQKLEKLIGP